MQIRILLDKAVEAKKNGEYRRALGYYLDALDIDPYNCITHYSMGKLFYILGQYDEAVTSYRKCDPNDHFAGYAGFLEMHLGHALVDPRLALEHQYLAEGYRCTIDPYFHKYGKKRFKTCSAAELEMHNTECAQIVVDRAQQLFGHFFK